MLLVSQEKKVLLLQLHCYCSELAWLLTRIIVLYVDALHIHPFHFCHHWPLFVQLPIIMGQNTGSVVHVCRRAVSFHSMNTTTAITSPHKPQHHAGSVSYRSSASPSPNNRSSNLTQVLQI